MLIPELLNPPTASVGLRAFAANVGVIGECKGACGVDTDSQVSHIPQPNPWGTRGERAATLSRVAGSGDRIAVHREAGERTSQKRFEIWPAGVAPGRARIISTTRRDTCRGCGGRKEWCDCRERTACERARGSTDPRRPSVEACRARNSFSRMISRLGAGRRTPDLDIRPAPSPLASGDALCMTRVGHGFIGSANKNVGGAK